MNIYIKNMVCVRCKMAVQSVLEQLGIGYLTIELGRVKLAQDIGPEQMAELQPALQHYQLELMEDRRKIITEQIKVLILEMFHMPEINLHQKFSDYLSKRMFYDYTYLANIFSETEGSTIERFYIVSRVERVKELIVYEKLNITEISYELNYSSVSHLCQQFKKVTGQTPSEFKKLCESEDFVWRNCE